MLRSTGLNFGTPALVPKHSPDFTVNPSAGSGFSAEFAIAGSGLDTRAAAESPAPERKRAAGYLQCYDYDGQFGVVIPDHRLTMKKNYSSGNACKMP